MFTIIIILHVLFWLLYQWFFSMALACLGVQQANLGIGQTGENGGFTPRGTQMWQGTIQTCTCVYNCVYIYGYNVFHRPHPVFSSILYVHVSEMLCCACFPAVVHVSQKLCTCHRSCARFTSSLITFVFTCIHTEHILISKSIGATKHVLPI